MLGSVRAKRLAWRVIREGAAMIRGPSPWRKRTFHVSRAVAGNAAVPAMGIVVVDRRP
jgi:hypothetical protein